MFVRHESCTTYRHLKVKVVMNHVELGTIEDLNHEVVQTVTRYVTSCLQVSTEAA